MNSFDNIIGYRSVKIELERIADILRGNKTYSELGVRIPRGLLLHGEPGLGKTLMAKCLIDESGRTAFTCRKDKPDGEFVNHIKDTFEKAKVSAPSIVFLDDMDKFANEDELHPDSEEYVAVQACIDEVKNYDVFVLATANRIHHLPDSLLRAGRFDRVIEIESPSEEDAVKIIGHYLKDKKVSKDIDLRFITRILNERSCAELETIINEAGIYAGFDKSPVITKKHFIDACLKTVFHSPVDAFDGEKNGSFKRKLVAYHEAGHALINEILEPGSVTLAVMYRNINKYGGFVSANYPKDRNPIHKQKNKAMVTLGGMASIEQTFGIHDGGACNDLDRAFGIVNDLIKNQCISGFHLHGDYENSPDLLHKQETAVSSEVDRLYRKTKEIIAANKEFLDRLAAELLENEILDMYDIERIKNEIKKQKAV